MGGGYTVLVKNYDLRHKSLKQKPFFLNFLFVLTVLDVKSD